MGCGTTRSTAGTHGKTKRSVMLFPGQFVKNLKESIYSLYTIRSEIGAGSYGRVVSAIHNITHQTRAIKIISKLAIQNTELRSKVINEVEILRSLDHPNIIKIYEFHEDEFNLYLIMDLCTGRELLETILRNGSFDEEQAKTYMKQILSALIYLHSLKVVHRDLKLENMLIEHTRSTNIKIIDFGTATYFNPKRFMTYRIGTMNYIAPEVLKKSYKEKCDVWSCGVILYVLLSGNLPFASDEKTETMKLIQSGDYSLEGGVWDLVSDLAKDLIKKMIDVNQNTRLSAAQAYNHPWFTASNPPDIKSNLLEVACTNLRNFHETSKLQRAVIRFIASQLLTPNEKNELDIVFKSIDSKATGKITRDDLKIFWKKYLSEDLSDDEIRKIMGRVDTDKNGCIEYSEFLVAAMDKRKLLSSENLEAVFNAFDGDKNGRISAQELKKMLDYTQDLDISVYANLIQEVDLNNDGYVDFKEFKHMMSSLFN